MEKEETVPLSPLKEPELKKQKMSTTSTSTSTSDGEEHGPTTAVAGDGPTCTREPRYKRRKVAIFFAYCGVGYQGMQKNPGAKTIEGDLEAALYQVGAVPENEKYQPRRYDWARSARTDKGVSAVGQVVSGKFYIDPPGFVERLNSTISHQIRIFGFKRVTASFNAKKFCDKRRYVYLIPVFALDPSAHRDRESVLASLGSGRELVKCLECSERGRKVFGIMGKRYQFDPETEPGILSNNEDVVATDLNTESNMVIENGASSSENVGSETELGILLNNGDASTILQNADSKVNVNASDLIAESSMVTENGASSVEERNEEVVKENVFCYGEKEKERFNRILKFYEGTHNFHNFTTRTKAEDPAAKRYIISFTADTVVNVEGIDFVKCEVIGQSFMLHQIRKMIGLAVAIMRNCSPESLIQTAFRSDVNINVPMAPEVGLYLDECFFTSYNKKWNDTHEEVSMKAYAEEAEEFKMKHIYSHIASTEHKDGTVALWLHSLNYRNYPDLRVVDNAISACSGDITEAVEAAVEVGLGTDARNADAGHGADLVNSGNVSGVCEGSEVVQTVVETGLGDVNNGESTNARNVKAGHDADLVNSDNVSGVCDGSEVVATVVETGVGAAINNGESTDARNVEAGHDADLVN